MAIPSETFPNGATPAFSTFGIVYLKGHISNRFNIKIRLLVY